MQELRRYFESLMGVAPVAAGEDTQWHLRFALGWPDWLLVVFGVFAVSFVLWNYRREGRAAAATRIFLASLRLMTILLVILMLGGLEIAVDRTGLPYLVFMIDDSESMRARDRSEDSDPATPAAEPRAPDASAAPLSTKKDPEPTRLERVKEWLARDGGRRLRELTARHKLQAHAQSTTVRLVGTAVDDHQVDDLLTRIGAIEPTGGESRLGANLREVLNNLRGAPPSSVVLVTDGLTTHGEPLPQAAQYAARKNIPVFTIGVGDAGEQRDLELHDLLVDNVVFVDDIVTFEAKLSGQGFAGREVTVALRQKGTEAPLDQRTYKVGPAGEDVKIRLAHRPKEPGTIEYVLDVPPQERELVTDNNRIERSVEVLKEKIRVLFVESYPRYEFRFLKNLLEREATVELKVLLLDSDPEYVQQDRSAIEFFPTRKQDLFDQDVIILGDVAPSLFTPAQLENLRDFVRVKGGGLLLIAGASFTPRSYRDTLLEDLLPVEIGPATNRDVGASGGFTPRLTLEGQANPIFRFAADDEENARIWRNMPRLYWFARVEKAKPGAQVLAENPEEARDGTPYPLVATQFFGAGRTYFQAFDSTWRWRYRVEELYHARYWIQAVRYLARSKLLGKNRSVELLADRRQYRRGDPINLRVRFLDESLAPRTGEGVTLAIEDDRQGNTPLELKPLAGKPSVFEGTLTRSHDGRYRARLSSPSLEGQPPTVDFVVRPPPGELDRVQMNEPDLRAVAELTGARYFPLKDADDLFSVLPPGQRVALHTDPPFSIWNSWPVLALFALLLALEWVVRKRKSMI